MNDAVKDELISACSDRSAFYRLLASLFFSEVTPDLLQRLSSIPFNDIEGEGSLEEGYRELKRYLARKGPDARTDLAVDYAKAFLAAGIYEGEAACPFESIYTSEDGMMMQDARDEVRGIYRENGIGVDQELNLPEDHLSFELEFLAVMAERAQEHLANGDEEGFYSSLATQRDFVQRHVQNWLPELSRRVNVCAEKSFYPAVMKITCGYIDEDKDFLDEAMASLHDR